MIGQDSHTNRSRDDPTQYTLPELPFAVGSLECPLERGVAQDLSFPHVLEIAHFRIL